MDLKENELIAESHCMLNFEFGVLVYNHIISFLCRYFLDKNLEAEIAKSTHPHTR